MNFKDISVGHTLFITAHPSMQFVPKMVYVPSAGYFIRIKVERILSNVLVCKLQDNHRVGMLANSNDTEVRISRATGAICANPRGMDLFPLVGYAHLEGDKIGLHYDTRVVTDQFHMYVDHCLRIVAAKEINQRIGNLRKQLPLEALQGILDAIAPHTVRTDAQG